ncbi:carboxylesterase family protein [Duganella sp. FT94W]|uniref:Carboxylesterase family protein n=1 Tax=Duganella lactea TaxID=2692173 RepID=A0ABW9V6S2_9BURK|nr:carboxylesterase family protein [Duganella lactea]
MNTDQDLEQQPVVQRLEDFDTRSGNLGERALFNYRPLVILLCLLATIVLGYQATHIRLNASFEKMIPSAHPYVANYLANKADLNGLGNSVRVAVETGGDSIYEAGYLDTLQRMNDELFLLPGVDRPFMKSLWTPSTRWAAVTEDGLDGGTVIPDGYDGQRASLAQLRANVARSGEIGQLVAANLRSSIIFVPLLDTNPQTGQPLDYRMLSESLERIRAKYEQEGVRIHITGFAKIAGDLIAGLQQVLAFFVLAIAIAAAVLFWYTRCWRSTTLVVVCSLVAVLWQCGLLATLHYELDPYSILVPFLVFAIGMSHGAQKMNGIMQDVGRGTHRVVAARYTFRRLFAAGLTALLCDAVGFAVLATIQIKVIQDLALIASIGVAVLIFTNLVLLPVLLSYTGVSTAAAARSLQTDSGAKNGLWSFLDRFTGRRWAAVTVAASVLLGGLGYLYSLKLQVGDLDPGAPELRADSRYNRDNGFMVANYAASSDILVVMIKTPPDQCTRYDTLAKVDTLAWQLEQLPGVDATNSMAALSKLATTGYNEGNFKWYDLIPNAGALGAVQTRAPRELFNQSCSLLSLYVYLKDHKAATLTRVVNAVEAYAAANNTPEVQFQLAAGSAGIEAATNIVVKQAMHDMLFWVYGAVILLCYATFRNWRAVVVAILPLVLTSILCEVLMVVLGMGVKVATLPVIALGVGIGVDYALYVLSVMLSRMRTGDSLSAAYLHALQFTGRVVILTGVTLAVAVATWVFSPIKFQADMGILLAFMFLWNMVGALVLVPALAHFLMPRQPAPETTPEPEALLPAPDSLRHTALGDVVGREDRHNTHAWLGLPYAAPPVGPLRWRAPRPAPAWPGVWQALTCGAPAMQLGGMTLDLPPVQWGRPVGAEDCLTLNIYAPRMTPEQAPAAGLPVMFWIHGGANTAGSASTYTTLRNLAGQDNVIVVSANYRLGILGWFSLEELARDDDSAADRSGNFGTLDLIAALQWVRQHIGAFGGDADNVTIFGESAGGLNVYTLLASPLAKGLFQRAIAQSPLTTSHTLAQARHYHDDALPGHALSSRELLCAWLQQAGRAANRDAAKALLAAMPASEIAAFARGLPPEALLAPVKPGALSFYDAPCVLEDGHVLPAMPLARVFEDRRRYHAVPIIIGTNRDEYKLFMANDPAHVHRLFGRIPLMRNRRRYLREAAQLSDLWQQKGALQPANAMLASGHDDVWVYRFDWDEQARVPLIRPDLLLGAAHVLELAFVFRDMAGEFDPFRCFSAANLPGRIEVSEAMAGYWIQFARNGQPDAGPGGALPLWNRWSRDARGQRLMVFDTRADGGTRMAPQPAVAHDDATAPAAQLAPALPQWP